LNTGTKSRVATGADLVVSALIAEDVVDVFGLPGLQLDPLFEAFYQRRDELSVYQVRHEQAASFMADGYARASGRIGCFAVVPGPGLLNAGAGLATAWACCSRVLCLVGQTPSGMIGRGHGALHELSDQSALSGLLTRWSGCALTVDEVPDLLRSAFAELKRDGGGPVAVELPPDVLEAGIERAWTREDPAPEPLPVAQIEAAGALLEGARAPVIFAGGGVLRSGASEELAALAERLACPVVLSTNAQGAIASEHPLAVSYLGARTLLEAADVIVAVGTRFTTPQSLPRKLGADQRLIHIDTDAQRLQRSEHADVAICADAGAALDALRECCGARSAWMAADELDALRGRMAALLADVQPQAAFGAAIRSALPADAVIVNGLTQVGYWARAGLPVQQPGTFLTSGFQGALGYELPTALGAQVALPDRRVVTIVGDGGFLFNAQELATAARYGLGVISIVFNDGAFGNVKRIQRDRYDAHYIASDLQNPDFGRLAEAFGVRAYRATGPDELEGRLRAALARDEPAVIEVCVGEMNDPWPVVAGTERI
jgi:acetolactate synthase-1/2/3 large subunit